MSVDSEFATSTKTSASRQNLSIQLSNSDVTSVPGLQGARKVKRLNAWLQKCLVICQFVFIFFCTLQDLTVQIWLWYDLTCKKNRRLQSCLKMKMMKIWLTYLVTCLQVPGRLEAEHIWSLAKTHVQDSRRPDSHPCGAHEPADLQSAEELRNRHYTCQCNDFF